MLHFAFSSKDGLKQINSFADVAVSEDYTKFNADVLLELDWNTLRAYNEFGRPIGVELRTIFVIGDIKLKTGEHKLYLDVINPEMDESYESINCYTLSFGKIRETFAA